MSREQIFFTVLTSCDFQVPCTMKWAKFFSSSFSLVIRIQNAYNSHVYFKNSCKNYMYFEFNRLDLKKIPQLNFFKKILTTQFEENKKTLSANNPIFVACIYRRWSANNKNYLPNKRMHTPYYVKDKC
jgi:hypothetical protein